MVDAWAGTPPEAPAITQPPSGPIYTQRNFGRRGSMTKRVPTSRLQVLKANKRKLWEELQTTHETRYISGLAKELRETVREIEEIEGTETSDEISDILAERDADGKAGAVRQNHT